MKKTGLMLRKRIINEHMEMETKMQKEDLIQL